MRKHPPSQGPVIDMEHGTIICMESTGKCSSQLGSKLIVKPDDAARTETDLFLRLEGSTIESDRETPVVITKKPRKTDN